MKALFFLTLFSVISCSAQRTDSKKGNDYPPLPYSKETIRSGDKSYTEHFRNMENMPDSIVSSWVRCAKQKNNGQHLVPTGKKKVDLHS